MTTTTASNKQYKNNRSHNRQRSKQSNKISKLLTENRLIVAIDQMSAVSYLCDLLRSLSGWNNSFGKAGGKTEGDSQDSIAAGDYLGGWTSWVYGSPHPSVQVHLSPHSLHIIAFSPTEHRPMLRRRRADVEDVAQRRCNVGRCTSPPGLSTLFSVFSSSCPLTVSVPVAWISCNYAGSGPTDRALVRSSPVRKKRGDSQILSP